MRKRRAKPPIATKRAAKLKLPAKRVAKKAAAKAKAVSKRAAIGVRERRLDDEQRSTLLLLLVAGLRESAIANYFAASSWKPLSSSTVSYYRKLWAKKLAEAKASRLEAAMVSGLALKAERIAALKEHAELLGALRFVADKKSGRLWNERAWRQTLEDIAVEMGDRKPKDTAAEQTIKVYVGLDPDKI